MWRPVLTLRSPAAAIALGVFHISESSPKGMVRPGCRTILLRRLPLEPRYWSCGVGSSCFARLDARSQAKAECVAWVRRDIPLETSALDVSLCGPRLARLACTFEIVEMGPTGPHGLRETIEASASLRAELSLPGLDWMAPGSDLARSIEHGEPSEMPEMRSRL